MDQYQQQQQRQQQFLLQQQQNLRGPSPILKPQMIQQPSGISTTPNLGQIPSISTELTSLGGPLMPAGMLALSQRMMPQQNSQQQYNTSGLQGNAKIPWAVSSEEKIIYRDIFKAWDTVGHGFISGEKGREVFSQSGLPENVLMQIWNLADPNNNGKLNQDEFAVAMHLLYRKLNGYDMPDVLPPELIPPSTRDLAESVDLLKNMLATDTHNQRTGLAPQISGSQYVKSRSFTHNPSADIRTDAITYKHEDDDIGYISSARRRTPSLTREVSSFSSTPSTRSESTRERSTTSLADLRKQIHEKEVLLDALSYSAETAPISSYDSSDIEDLKRRVKDLQSQIDEQRSSANLDWNSRDIIRNAEELNSLIDRHQNLEYDFNNMLYTTIPDLVQKIRDTDNKVAEAKLELFKLRESSSSEFSNIVGTGPGGTITDSDKIKAKAAAMLQARMAAITGKPIQNVGGSAPDPKRLEEETIKINADKTTREQRVSDIEKVVSRLQDSIVRSSRERDDIEAKLKQEGLRSSEDDRRKWEDGIDVTDEVRRLIEDIKRDSLSTMTKKSSYSEPNLESHHSTSSKSSYSTSVSTSSNYSLSTSTPSLSSKSKTPEERAAFIKAEAERRMQERLRALGGSSPKSTPSPAPNPPSITDRLARERAESVEKVARAEREAEERERTRAERLLAEKKKKEEEEAERARRVEEYERREAERRAQWLAEAQELEKAKDKKAREKEEAAARARELEKERKLLEEAEQERKEKEHLARMKREAEERAAEEEQYRKEQEAIAEGARAARERAKKLEEEAKEREEALKRETERLAKVKKEESVWQVKPAEPLIVEKSENTSTNPFLKFSVQSAQTEETPVAKPIESTNPFFKFTKPTAAASIPPWTSTRKEEQDQDDWDVVDKEESDSDDDDFGMPGHAKALSANIGIAPPSTSTGSEAFPSFEANASSVSSPQVLSNAPTVTFPTEAIPVPPPQPSSDIPIPPPPPSTSSNIPTPPPSTSSNIPIPPPPPSTSSSIPTPPPPLSASSSIPTPPPAPPQPAQINNQSSSAHTPLPTRPAALLSQIQKGTKLRPTATNDRSAPLAAGRSKESEPSAAAVSSQVGLSSNTGLTGPPGLGALFSGGIPTLKSRGGTETGREDNAAQKTQARPTTPGKADRRVSIDWIGSLASDQLEIERTPSRNSSKDDAKTPSITVEPPADMASSIEQDVDFSIEFKVKSLFEYSGTNADDLPFKAGVVFTAHPSKNEKNADWWYGTLETDDKKGWFPKNYVEPFKEEQEIFKAKVLYDFKASNAEELDIKQGTIISILDQSLGAWWKAEYEGAKGIVPANYVEEISSGSDEDAGTITPQQSSASDSETEGPFNFHSTVRSSSPLETNSSNLRARSPSPTRLFGTSPINERRLSINTLSEAGLLPVGFGLRPDSPGPGQRPPSQTWSSFLGEEAIEGIPKEERKRQEAIYELITTEQSYLRDLQMIVEVFYGPLQNILDSRELATIFSNIEDILLCNTAILSDLEDRQREEGFFVDSVGDILVKHAENFGYYVVYCGNQTNASKFLQVKRVENQRLAEFLKQCLQDPRCGSLDLSSFLLKPLQRITRYPLLFRQILHYTNKSHPDHENMLHCLKVAEDFLEKTNEAVREQENQVKLSEILKLLDLDGLEEKFDLTSMTRLLGKRQYITEGSLQKVKSNRKLYGYLFNDLLILAQPMKNSHVKGYKYSLYKPPIPLNEITVQDSSQDECFQVVHTSHATINLRAKNISDKRQWVNKLETASRHYLEMERKNQVKDGKTPFKNYIGTLRVVICDAMLPIDPVKEKNNISVYCQAQLNRQVFKTKLVKEPRWNQVLLFSVMTLDDTLKLSLYNYYDKYTQEYLGQAEIGLRFLEKYQETDKITLQLRDVPPGHPPANISIYLSYKVIA